ncbi:MAG TPA: transporter [Tepidisphaeraceae bacterium]|jgi:hypothetical protein|nr:transporter [Tepidisphaeraceae bacterium]
MTRKILLTTALLTPPALADDFSFDLPPLLAQVVNPADAQRRPFTQPEAPPERLRSFELPPVTVVAEKTSDFKEEDRIGSYAQPRWTATRRFTSTRVYVVPENKVEFEYWLRPTINKDGSTETRSLYELELGLPHRFQLDLYLRTDQDGDTGDMLLGEQIEVRWAFADWGKLPGNPTVYFEYVMLEDRPDKIEPKLLLGGQLAPRWHWGANLVAEIELGGPRSHEYQLTGALSYTLIDSKLSVGGESQLILTDIAGNRGNFTTEVLLGPSVQFRPLPQMTINFAPLVGLTDDSPDAQIYLNIGWEF